MACRWLRESASDCVMAASNSAMGTPVSLSCCVASCTHLRRLLGVGQAAVIVSIVSTCSLSGISLRFGVPAMYSQWNASLWIPARIIHMRYSYVEFACKYLLYQ